jgi:DUF4097 and DUF4098 domain-containing protein YvlB
VTLEQSYSAEGLTTLDVELRRGDVRIDESTTDQVSLVATFSSGAVDLDLRIDRIGDTLRIVHAPADVERDQGGLAFLSDLGLGQLAGQIGRIDLQLRVPATIRRVGVRSGLGSIQIAPWLDEVKVRTGLGDVGLAAGGGQVELASGMGSLRVGRIARSCSLQTGMGEVRLEGGEGAARLHTGKGTVQIADANLRLEANTGWGEVKLERVAGEANLRTGFGRLTVAEARDLAVEAYTGNGDLRLSGEFRTIRAKSGFGAILCDARRLSSSADLNTGNGDVDVAFNTEGATRIDAATGRGRIESQVPLVQVGQPGPQGFFNRRVVGTAGSGEVHSTIRIRSGNGNIRLRYLAGQEAPASAGPTPTEAAASFTDSTSAEPKRSRLEVLQALQRGEIGVDEAERLLAQS